MSKAKRGTKSYGTILNKLCLARRAKGRKPVVISIKMAIYHEIATVILFLRNDVALFLLKMSSISESSTTPNKTITL